MAAEIIPDVVDGAEYSVEPSSANLTRAFYVGGINPTIDAVVQVFNNGGANGVNLPTMAAPHPTVYGLIAMGFRCQPVQNVSRTGVMVYVTYGPQWVVEIIGDDSDDTVSTWPAGHQLANLPILIPYCSATGSRFTLPINPVGLDVNPLTNNGQFLGGTNVAGADNTTPGNFYDIAQVTRLSSRMAVRFTTIQGVSPLTLSKTYRGKLNLTTWQGGAPKTWMMRAIDGCSVPYPWGFTMYRTSYVAAYDPNTWATAAAFTDTRTGKPPPDVYFDTTDPLSGNGLFLIDDGMTVDFAGMGLPNAL